MQKNALLSIVLLLCASVAISQTASRETVRLVSFHAEKGNSMRVVMESQTAIYTLKCPYKTAGCIVPTLDQPYYLITESHPFGKYDLDWLEDWYGKCDIAPTVGLAPTSGWPTKKNDFMEDYDAVGAYCLESLTARK